MSENEEILFSLEASRPRRAMGVFSLSAIGVLLLSLAFEAQGMWSLIFLAFAIAAFVGSLKLWQSTSDIIDLTKTELRTRSGRVLTPVANVKSVDRGAFAFKPSNGFLIKLEEPAGRGWAPGLWWQRGRLIGVGGVIPGGQSRAMAEILMAVKDGSYDQIFK